MGKIQKLPEFQNDGEISTFMEAHDGFELVDEGLADIVETPVFSGRGKSSIELDSETLQLVNELVKAGICTNMQDAIANAIHSYVLAVLPGSYKLVREK
jgi:hypothetical protein